MKKIFYILTLIATIGASAQSISPDISSILCPNQEYTFTVSGLPGNYTGMNSIGGVNITQFPSSNGTTITFKARFQDITGSGQGFEISYSGSNIKYKRIYTKIKSLFGGYKVGANAPSGLNIPICQTTPVTIPISGDQYWDHSTNPSNGFSSITQYRFLIPAGWYLNGTLSTGSNWIISNGTHTITPDAFSGGGGIITYVARNDCGAALTEGTPRVLAITRPNPTFSLNPSSLTFVCGTPQTRIFTVSASSTLNCPVTYNWNLGANNGWLYNGSPAPANFTTSTNSITLSSANGNVLPSSVRVTPILNGNNYPELTCSTNFTPFTSQASISGVSNLCLQGSSTFLIDAGVGNTVTWTSSDPTKAFVSSQNNSQATITPVAQGVIILTALITNPCGQTTSKVKTIAIGNPLFVVVRSQYSPPGIRDVTLTGVNGTNLSEQGITNVIWEVVGPNPSSCGEFSGGGFNGTMSYYGTCSMRIKITVTNSCGSTIIFTTIVGTMRPGSQLRTSNSTSDEFNSIDVYPNPVKDDLFIKLKDFNNNISQEEEVLIEIFDIQGKKVKNFSEINNNFSLDIRDLNKGIYLLKVQIKDIQETHKIVVE